MEKQLGIGYPRWARGSREMTCGSLGRLTLTLTSATCREEMAQTSQIAWVISKSGAAACITSWSIS